MLSPFDVARQLPQPENLNTPVWRYMSLGHFVSLLLYRQLWLAPLDRLGDRFEGIAPGPVVNATIANTEFASYGFEPTTDRIQALHAIRRDMFVSCWNLSPVESDLMWRAHAPEDGVVLKTTYENLRGSVGGLPVGLVEYRDFNRYREPYDPVLGAWLKRLEFAGEQEVRVGLFRRWFPNLAPADSGSVYYGMPITWEITDLHVIAHPKADYELVRTLTDLMGRLNSPIFEYPLVAYSHLAAAPPY